MDLNPYEAPKESGFEARKSIVGMISGQLVIGMILFVIGIVIFIVGMAAAGLFLLR